MINSRCSLINGCKTRASSCFCVSVLSVDAELNSVKLLLQRLLLTLSQTVTETQSSSLLDLKSLSTLSEHSSHLFKI